MYQVVWDRFHRHIINGSAYAGRPLRVWFGLSENIEKSQLPLSPIDYELSTSSEEGVGVTSVAVRGAASRPTLSLGECGGGGRPVRRGIYKQVSSLQSHRRGSVRSWSALSHTNNQTSRRKKSACSLFQYFLSPPPVRVMLMRGRESDERHNTARFALFLLVLACCQLGEFHSPRAQEEHEHPAPYAESRREHGRSPAVSSDPNQNRTPALCTRARPYGILQ